MTSTVSAAQPQQAAQSAIAVSSGSGSGKTSPLPAVPAQPTAKSSYASATASGTKKPSTPPVIASSNPPVAVGSSVPIQHGKSHSASPVNPQKPIQPAVPSVGAAPSIANGADHSRKPSSVTIPNGGSAGASSNRPNIVFGSTTAEGSPVIANSSVSPAQASNLNTPQNNNPRVQSPAASPSPIPQPAASGGRPPSGLQNQGNLNFGMTGDNSDHGMRPMPQGPANAQAQHLRRESSQSAHSDMSSGNFNRQFTPNGRGRGFAGGYPPQMSNSPGPQFRQPMMPSRGGPNIPPFQAQGPMGQHANSPFRPATRSPAMAPAALHQQPHMASGPPMQHGGYGGYPQQLHPSQVKPSLSHPSSGPFNTSPSFTQSANVKPLSPAFSHATTFKSFSPRQQHTSVVPNSTVDHATPFVQTVSVPDLSRDMTYGQFLTELHHPQGVYGVAQQYDPGYAQYYPPGPYMHGVAPFGAAPPSPQPYQTGPHRHQPFIPNQFMPNANSMSRNPSQDAPRPPSASLGHPQTPSMAPATIPPQTPSQQSSSPAPTTGSQTTFIRQAKGSKAIPIMKPDGGAVTIKPSPSPSPAPSNKGPVIVSTPGASQTPIASTAKEPEAKADAPPSKTSAEKKQEFEEQFKRNLEEQAKREKAEAEKTAAAAKEKEVTEASAAPKPKEAEKAEATDKSAAATPAEEKPAETPAEDDEEEWIRQMEEEAREEEERERKYQEKKKRELEERREKEKEAAAREDEELRRAEREAEEAEEAREKKREAEKTETAEDKAEREKLFASLKRPTFGPAARAAAADSGASTPGSDSAMPPPAQPASKSAVPSGLKPKPEPLKIPPKHTVPDQPTPGMQALKSARFLQVHTESVTYPAGIQSPNPALNQGSKTRGRQYDKDFLLQFQDVFKEKPSTDWDTKLRETVGDPSDSSRPGSARTPSGTGRQPSRGGMGSGLGGPMGLFNVAGPGGRTLPPGTTSADRFAASMNARPAPMGNNPFGAFPGRAGGFPVGGPAMMQRQGSTQGMNSPRPGGSQRGKGGSRRGEKTMSAREQAQQAAAMPLTAGQEVKPLEVSSTGWKPMSLTSQQSAATSDFLAPDVVQRKVKAALNKMTPEKFDKISNDILVIAEQSKHETDGRTLRQVIQLTFEKACDEAHWASMYAKFCSLMLAQMSKDIKDENVKDKNGNPVVGGPLFRKYLLNRCQEEFERGWEIDLPERPEGQTEEAAMLSDEYYVAAAAKRRGLGLIQFIGELFKLGMLTGRIMHECVLKLLNFEGLPDESAIESLSKLLRTIGEAMDSDEKGQAVMNHYFERIEKIVGMEGLPSRMRFMMMDVVDLRKSGWRSKEANKGPKTIQEIHAEAQAAKAEQELERQRQHQRGGNRPPMGRGDSRSFSGNMGPPDYARNQVEIADLRKLSQRGGSGRNISSGANTSFAPSMFGSRSGSGRRGLGPPGLGRGGDDSGASSRTGTPPVKEKESNASANSFSALAAMDASGENAEDVASPPSAPSSPPMTRSNPANGNPVAAKADGDKAEATADSNEA